MSRIELMKRLGGMLCRSPSPSSRPRSVMLAGYAPINPALVTDLEMLSNLCGSGFNIGAKRLTSYAKVWLCDSGAS